MTTNKTTDGGMTEGLLVYCPTWLQIMNSQLHLDTRTTHTMDLQGTADQPLKTQDLFASQTHHNIFLLLGESHPVLVMREILMLV